MINVFTPQITLSDIFSVTKALFKTYISGTSPSIREFENSFSSFIGKRYGVAVANGSVALDLSLQLLDLKEDDEIILPSFTIVSALSAVLRTPAKPIFCDIDEYSWNSTIQNIEKLINKKTKALIMVHTYGLVADAIKIKKLCAENNIVLIEDAAESHGQSIDGKMCGNFGDISTFSFYANKHVTTGEGGMILTDSKENYQKLLQMRNLDFNNEKRFVHHNLYWNYRMSGLQAALGTSQIKNINRTINLKIKQANIYQELLEQHSKVLQLPLRKLNSVDNHYWVFGVVLKDELIRDKVIESMNSHGVETRPFFYPLHLQPLLKDKVINSECYISEKIGLNGLYLPMGKGINRSKQKFIVEKLIYSINHAK